MKLKNKKTGEVVEVESCNSTTGTIGLFFAEGRECDMAYSSLAELNEEWEDVPEEPKVGYIIDPMEEDCVSADDSGYEVSDVERAKELGIWLETEEEAEKAVRKLKAWKRLKDKGFKFIDHIDRDSGQGMTRYEWDGYVNGEDLDLLFGGEEKEQV